MEYNNKKVNEIVDGLRLIDDTFMKLFFQGNTKAVELMLNIILKKDNLVLEKPVVEKTIMNPETGGKDVAFDIYARDNNGKRYDIEMQRTGGVGLKKRGRFYSAALDHIMLKAGEDYKQMQDSYVIFLLEKDYFQGKKPIYEIERMNLSTNERFCDGNHLIFVNCAYVDSTTRLGRLIHDLLCSNAIDMYYDELRISMAYYKSEEGGRLKMCKAVEDYAKDYAKEYAKEVSEEYRMQAEVARENEAKAKENEAKMKQKFEEIIRKSVKKKRNLGVMDDEIKSFIMDAYDLSDEEADVYLRSVEYEG